jgi:hypothetical protein
MGEAHFHLPDGRTIVVTESPESGVFAAEPQSAVRRL